MELVRRSLQESEEKATKRKKVQKSMVGDIQFERTKIDISKIQREQQSDQNISFKCADLDKSAGKELSVATKIFEKEQIALLKRALSEQRALFDRTIARDRAIANEALRETRQQNEKSIKEERETMDSLNNQARAQVEELENERLRLKGIIENLIQQNEVLRNNNYQVPDGMICMPRCHFDIAANYYCGPGIAMHFKLFKLKQVYPDLQKYDHRAIWGTFGIRGTSVKFPKFMHSFMNGLFYQGHKYDSQVYYLNPVPGSQPPTGLVEIVGEDDVKEMVRAHAEQGTKICLVYLVSRHEAPSAKDYHMEPYPMEESDEEAPETSNADVLPGI